MADDPDDRDLVYGDGDTLTVVFDRATDRSRSSTGGVHAGGQVNPKPNLYTFLTLTLTLTLIPYTKNTVA